MLFSLVQPILLWTYRDWDREENLIVIVDVAVFVVVYYNFIYFLSNGKYIPRWLDCWFSFSSFILLRFFFLSFIVLVCVFFCTYIILYYLCMEIAYYWLCNHCFIHIFVGNYCFVIDGSITIFLHDIIHMCVIWAKVQ